MKSPFFSVLILLACLVNLPAQEPQSVLKPRCFLLSVEKLDKVKSEIKSGDPAATAACKELARQAAKRLKVEKLPSVTNNDYIAPGGTKNDYVSFSTYYWPDPSKSDGLPFIRRDGETNRDQLRPEMGHDGNALNEMIQAVKILVLAGYLTDDPKFTRQAIRYLRCWFLDPETRMNPNLQYSQGVRGKNDGTATGVIDTHRMTDMMESLGLLEASPDWTAEDRQGMKRWFTEFVDWLRTSKSGQRESLAVNNHGTWYDTQVVAYALYAENAAVAKETLEKSKARIDSQIDAEGRQPEELRRTLPFTYSTMNLGSLLRLAKYGDCCGVDLWNYTGSKGGSIRKAYEFLLPFAEEREPWQYKDLSFKPSNFRSVLLLTGDRFPFDAEKWKNAPNNYDLTEFFR